MQEERQDIGRMEEEPFGGSKRGPDSDETLLGGVCYLSQVIVPGVLPIVLLLVDETKRSPYMHFHAIQSLALMVVSLCYFVVAALVYVISTSITGCLACVLWSLFLVPAGVFVYYGIKALQGEWSEIPWLTAFLRENDWL